MDTSPNPPPYSLLDQQNVNPQVIPVPQPQMIQPNNVITQPQPILPMNMMPQVTQPNIMMPQPQSINVLPQMTQPNYALPQSEIWMNIINFGPEPQYCICPNCRANIKTVVTTEATMTTHIMALILCGLCLWPCVILPYCMESCNRRNHYCPNCSMYLGKYPH